MLKTASLGLVLAAIYTDYPGFLRQHGVVEAYTDRGPIYELIVRCPSGTGILSYSKIDGKYCSAKGSCTLEFGAALADTCR